MVLSGVSISALTSESRSWHGHVYAGDTTPPLHAQTPVASVPLQAPAVALKKHVSFTGLTVELFEDVEEVR